jgi:translation initiation factor 1
MRLFEGTPFDIPPRCECCGELETDCRCSPAQKTRIAPEKQTARVVIEKRKKGKVVTVVHGLTATANDLPGLLAHMKSSCGAGGTTEGDTVEIQGDHVTRVRELLARIGYRLNPR